MRDMTVNRFRKARGLLLARQIKEIKQLIGHNIKILDVGGRADYWNNIGFDNISHITIVNYSEEELEHDSPADIFDKKVGDARDLSEYADKSFDLVHSNSVIEHVGHWQDMSAMARELTRVGKSGWVQTPAWEFPIEPHYRAPFLHWFAPPLRRSLLWMSKRYRDLDVATRRYHIDRINLLSKTEFQTLFPESDIYVERLVLAKSYVARWMPAK